jgi:3-oxoisoapionate kinase
VSLVLAYYGDDFTGSTDVMESLEWAGLRTVLFLSPPTLEQLRGYPNLRAFGVAGWSRTMSPDEMEQHLRPALQGLRDSGAPLVHYKICSTFDSSPSIGSIGKALEVGRDVFGEQPVPIVVGAPVLGRFQVFGNLFARSGLDTEPYRLDRHPTMRQHPITPMGEADLRCHLNGQTELPIGLVDVLQWSSPGAAERILEQWRRQAPAAALLDVLTNDHLPAIGQVLQRLADAGDGGPQLVIGSSGVEYALAAYWQQSGQLDSLRSHPAGRPEFGSVEQLLVITGGCSPVTDRQTRWAIEHGFAEVELETARLVDPKTCDAEIDRVVAAAQKALRGGASLVVHSSRGATDPRIAATLEMFRRQGLSELEIKLHSGRLLGPKLGKILQQILGEHPLPRVGVAGGDTSGYVARQLGIEALEAVAPAAPGSPLCRTSRLGDEGQGMEIVFKGGQVGHDDFWGTLLNGTKRPASAAD